jgi:hypothetical protein
MTLDDTPPGQIPYIPTPEYTVWQGVADFMVKYNFLKISLFSNRNCTTFMLFSGTGRSNACS